jgi:hypothetical protein
VKSAVAGLTAIVAAIIFVVVGIIGWSVGRGAVVASVGAVAVQVQTTVPTHVYLTVATPDMLKTDVGPAVLPSAATVPANSDVIVTILNFDGATPLTGAYTKFATAAGIEGKFTVVAVNTANPNGPSTAPARTLAAVDPAIVSHTFTIPSLHLNVPLLASSRTTFTFHTGAAGTFEWHCQDPCGTGPAGWSGAMSVQGYMGGELTVI